MKSVIVVQLTPETRAEINSAMKRVSDSAQKLIDAHKGLAAAGARSTQALAKASECLRLEQHRQSKKTAGACAQSQMNRFRERRRFPIPKSQKMR